MAGRSASFHALRAGLAPAVLLFGLAASGCSPDLSPNTYNSGAVQQANKAEQGVVVGVRHVDVKVSGATGAVVGGAAGGIAGSQLGPGTTSAFGALGGSLIGGLIGTGVEHAGGDTTAYEYIVRKANKELVSVTQKDDPPLAIGEHVLVIAGSQARIVPDYTVSLPPETPEAAKESLHAAGPVPPAAGATPGTTPPAGAPPQDAPAKSDAAPPADAAPGGSNSPAPAAAAQQGATTPAVSVTTTTHAASTSVALPATIPVPDALAPGAPVNLVPTKLTPSVSVPVP